jgi:hypothetical protein
MARIGGTKGWVAAAGAVLLMAFVAVPALSGAANAAPVTSAAVVSPSTQWAYGGQGWSNNTLQFGNVTISYDAAFGWTVVYTVTPTAPNTWMLEEQRTVGVTVSVTYSGPLVQATYHYHGQEVDVGFANLTNQSVVYVNGQPVPALGIENASAAVNASISEAVTKTVNGQTASASLSVTGVGSAAAAFSPSLGIVPLNLSGIDLWNSSSTATLSGAWTLSYNWADQGYNGTTGSGSGMTNGSLSGSGPVELTGIKLHVDSTGLFHDGKDRTAIVLIVQGPFDDRDGFLFVPHDLDLFGNAPHEFDSASFSAETLYLSAGPSGPSVTAAASTFGANDASVNALATPAGPSGPAAATASPSDVVLAQPMSVPAANAQANCLTHGCGGAAAAGLGGALVLALVAIALVVGTVGVIEWRSYARRRSRSGLVGGYGESWPNGVPPAAAVTPPPTDSSQGGIPADDPTRRL